MTRLTLSLAAWFCALIASNPARACPVDATATALVDTGLSALSEPLVFMTYGRPEASRCRAVLLLRISALASRRLVPRPRELAELLVPVASAYGVQSCDIFVDAFDDTVPAAERTDEDSCWTGEFRYDGGSWSEVEADQPCG
jgi:hypothetical protein